MVLNENSLRSWTRRNRCNDVFLNEAYKQNKFWDEKQRWTDFRVPTQIRDDNSDIFTFTIFYANCFRL